MTSREDRGNIQSYAPQDYTNLFSAASTLLNLTGYEITYTPIALFHVKYWEVSVLYLHNWFGGPKRTFHLSLLNFFDFFYSSLLN